MSAATITEFAPAKINLALHVTGQREDGYHLLDTLVAFADVGDRLNFAPADELTLSINGTFGAGLSTDDDNLVLRAATALRKAAGATTGAEIRLEKNLPLSSGIGGGSADAAAALRGLAALWDTDTDLASIAAKLGADVPMCLKSEPLRAQGIGEQLQAVVLPGFHIVLANPGVAVSTPAIFSRLDRKDHPPLDALEDADGDWLMWLTDQRNDLEAPAFSTAPEIAQCLDALWGTSRVRLARMSGSGATCFALYDSEGCAARAAAQLKAAYPDWWVTASQLQGSTS
ncbi:4-(cytidine 5'-diphospho)-2-C-methyl-D-erythritol kinase [Ahrensia sp. R2A130]|uniref:4-(cytidine 5'-diphospho)-2-C-methyl-D-erythritol kinase n=1 Tax=Ahrensia sp. R2A130 TaxID=744979 RepID=UPI000A041E48|nr:4-(cytidine 5'-diphospho)-2-C-methyl-D-erythritol kinase [Ahrensia sp. R2A130]